MAIPVMLPKRTGSPELGAAGLVTTTGQVLRRIEETMLSAILAYLPLATWASFSAVASS